VVGWGKGVFMFHMDTVIYKRANVERLWKVVQVQVVCLNEKVSPPPTGHRGRRDLVFNNISAMESVYVEVPTITVGSLLRIL